MEDGSPEKEKVVVDGVPVRGAVKIGGPGNKYTALLGYICRIASIIIAMYFRLS